MRTARIMFLPRALSEVKQEIHNHNLEISTVGHDGEMAVVTYEVPDGFSTAKFHRELRNKYKDVI